MKELKPSLNTQSDPLVLNSYLSLKLILLPLFHDELLFFLVYLDYSYCFFLLDSDVRERRDVDFKNC